MFSLYSKIPGFRRTYGGNPSDRFTRFEIGKESKATTKETYLTLELTEAHTTVQAAVMTMAVEVMLMTLAVVVPQPPLFLEKLKARDLIVE
jgi:hypothetical protein